MRTGTFHTFDRYIYHQNIHLFLSIREVLLLLLSIFLLLFFFFIIAGHVHFRKAGHDLWIGRYGYDSFRQKKKENRELVYSIRSTCVK